MDEPRDLLPASVEGVMEFLWPRIGHLWQGAAALWQAFAAQYCPSVRADLLAQLAPAEAMLRRALVLLAYEQGIGNFYILPSFSISFSQLTIGIPGAEDKPPLFRLCERAPREQDDAAGGPAPLPGPAAPDAPPAPESGPAPDPAAEARALEQRLLALDAALEDPFTHVTRMGRLLWRAGEDDTPPPVTVAAGAPLPPGASTDSAKILVQLNARAQLALWHHPPPG